MRRNLTNQFNPVIRLAGVTVRLISRNTSVSIPVVRVTNSKGLAPTCLRYTSHKSRVSGTRPLTKSTSLAKRVSFMANGQLSVVNRQLHFLFQLTTDN